MFLTAIFGYITRTRGFIIKEGDFVVFISLTVTFNVNQNKEPRPSELSKPISPPRSLTSCLQIARPRPVPGYLRVEVLSI